MGLGLVYPPMATLEYPAPASRSDQDTYVSRAAPWVALSSQGLQNDTWTNFLGACLIK